MEGIRFIKKPKLKSPYLICAWPGMGDVAFKAATVLVEKLKATEFAELLPQGFFYLTGSMIQDGLLVTSELPYGKFFFWKNKGGRNDLIIFISNAQPDLVKAEEYCQAINQLAKSYKVKRMVGFAAMPQPVDHAHTPAVWFAATSREIKEEFKKFNFSLLTEGQISGMNGLFLGIAKREGFPGFCLLGEIPLYTIQIENPKSSYAVLDALARILDIRIDLTSLLDQAHVMEEEINKLLDYLKVGAPSDSPIGEEEIEKIKKTLSQLTKLPASVKEKIERLFSQTTEDISKASELKSELDRWNVYKEYEDRFLDLFKKHKENNN